MTNKPPPTQRETNPIQATKNTPAVISGAQKPEAMQVAALALSTTTLNAMTATRFTKHVLGEVTLPEALTVLNDNVSKINAGDLTSLEATLTSQVISLDTIFNAMANRASASMNAHPSVVASYMRLAFKAQAQCARTIEVIAKMKNPTTVYAKQANISNGHHRWSFCGYYGWLF